MNLILKLHVISNFIKSLSFSINYSTFSSTTFKWLESTDSISISNYPKSPDKPNTSTIYYFDIFFNILFVLILHLANKKSSFLS